MAEGLMKKFYGHETYVQSAGVLADMDVDGFAIAVCAELGIELARHKTRSFDEMQKLGDELSSFDLIVALSPASQRKAKEITRFYALQVEYWPIMDPTVTKGKMQWRHRYCTSIFSYYVLRSSISHIGS